MRSKKTAPFFLIQFILTFLSFGFTTLAAQSDSTLIAQQDSTLLKQGEEGFNILFVEDSTRTADSLQQIMLLQEIAELRKRDARKKAELQARVDSIKNAQKQRTVRIKLQVDSLRANTKGVAVVLDKDTLIKIYSKLGPFSPSERVASIQRKIDGIVNQGSFSREKLIVFTGEESFDLVYEDQFILSITERDAFWMNDTPENVAKTYKETIVAGIENHMKEHGLVQNAKRVGWLALVLITFILIIRYLNKGFSTINRYFIRRFKKYIHSVKIKNYELLTEAQAEYTTRWTLKIFKWFLIIILLYISLPIVFSIFPTTEGIAETLISYVAKPLLKYSKAFVQFLPNLFSIAIIIIMSRLLVKLLAYFSKEIELGKLKLTGFYDDWAKPTFNLLRILIYAFAFVMVFPYLPGSDSPIFRGVSVFFGLLISLGSSSAISNIIAGLVITYMRPFKIGDKVKVGDVSGQIVEKTMLVTRLRTIKNEDVSIPNAAILNGSTTNYSSSAKSLGLILNSSVTIGYDIPWRKVHELLIEAANNTALINDNPQPFVLQTSLDDFYVSYQVNAYTQCAEKASRIYSDLHANILDAFNRAEIEILSPHYQADRNGEQTTIIRSEPKEKS
jgi:small-conductance mechanosensitive channel